VSTGGGRYGSFSTFFWFANLSLLASSITAAEAHILQQQGALLIDVRERGESLLGHADGALLLAKSVLQREPNQLPSADRIILICQSGVRSAALLPSLNASHPTMAFYSVMGGSNAWQQAGLPWQAPTDFASDEITRYSRQMILPEFGFVAQRKLRSARVLLVGAGGLGSPAALYLAAAGVGELWIADGDQVELSNLHRQVLHRHAQIGMAKTASAKMQLEALNPHVRVQCLPAIDIDNVDQVLSAVDVVLDGSDNFQTRCLVADAAVKNGKPYVYGAVLRFDGQLSVFHPQDADPNTPCYRCLFAEPPDADSAPNCAEAGVLGVLPGVIGTLQAGEVLKLITGIGQVLNGALLLFDALTLRFRHIKLPRDVNCRVCAPGAQIVYQRYDQVCASDTP
jgi:sulfur-carrier protein adenylyltransferase/sulfurtransferase